MPRGKHSKSGGTSLLAALSLGSLVLGIGCIGWALVNIIGAQSALSRDVYKPLESALTTITVPTATVSVKSKVASAAPAPAARNVSYSAIPTPGKRFGDLTIPALKQTLPIIQGTDEADLNKGVGHFLQSVLPGRDDNCVLSGHRDTFFARLGRLKVGDRVIAQTAAGTFTYRVRLIRIVGKDDRTVIVHTDHAVLTLSTCYPFHFVGSAPKRYIVVADLVTGR